MSHTSEIQSYVILYRKLNDEAISPTRNNEDDAGIDLYALEDTIIPSIPRMIWKYVRYMVFAKPWAEIEEKSKSDEIENDNILATKIKTGIAFEIPKKQFGLILDRSSVGSKLIKVLGGVIDSTYRGDVTVCLMNLSFQDYKVKKGDKIAQIVILPCNTAIPSQTLALSETERNDKGFGSSGK